MFFFSVMIFLIPVLLSQSCPYLAKMVGRWTTKISFKDFRCSSEHVKQPTYVWNPVLSLCSFLHLDEDFDQTFVVLWQSRLFSPPLCLLVSLQCECFEEVKVKSNCWWLSGEEGTQHGLNEQHAISSLWPPRMSHEECRDQGSRKMKTDKFSRFFRCGRHAGFIGAKEKNNLDSLIPFYADGGKWRVRI